MTTDSTIMPTPPIISAHDCSIMVNDALPVFGSKNTIDIIVTIGLHASSYEGIMSKTFLALDTMYMLSGHSFGNIIDISSIVFDFVNMSILEINLAIVNHSNGMFISVGTPATSILTGEIDNFLGIIDMGTDYFITNFGTNIIIVGPLTQRAIS